MNDKLNHVLKFDKARECKWYNNKTIDNSIHLWYPNNIKFTKNNKYSNKNYNIENCININQSKFKFNIKNVSSSYEDSLNEINKKYNLKLSKLEQNYINDKDKLNIQIKTLNTKKEKEINSINKVLHTKPYVLQLNNNQTNTIFNWFFECDRVYNRVIYMFNNKNPNFVMDYRKLKLVIFNDLYPDKKPVPYDILTDEVRIALSNIKSCMTNLKNKNINNFNINYRSFNLSNRRSILIPYKSITNKGIYSTILNKISNFDKLLKYIEDIKNIKSDCRLVYDKITKKFLLYMPIYKDKRNIKNRNEIVALDPGEKIFQTYYSSNECGKIGENIRLIILKYQDKIKKYQRILKKNTNKNKKKLKNKITIKKKIRKYYQKIKNIVKDLHHKTAKYLCEKYDNIIIPKFETSKMIKNKNTNTNINKDEMKRISKMNKLNKKVKFVLSNLSHFKFRQYLSYKCVEYDCQLLEVTEEYTSKCCSRCGFLSDNYEKREKICPYCNLKIDRDINGSRNILLKTLNEIGR
jgi:putative transposase